MKAMVGWNLSGNVEVGPWPDETGWSLKYRKTIGACVCDRHRMSREKQFSMMLLDFHTITVGDGLDPHRVHREFLKIDEYRQRIAHDIAGAD